MTDWRTRKWAKALLMVAAFALFICFVLLGNWQLYRLDWKRSLIQAVEERAFNLPVAAPTADQWPSINAEKDAYHRVKATGHFLYQEEIPVVALTELGGGYWIMTPLLRDNSEMIWVNRGFVPTELKEPGTRPVNHNQAVTVTGLLRMSEPKGTFLQSNDPMAGRWYSRDLEAFSSIKDLPQAAPYFIDAGPNENEESWPRGGMTRVTFRNNHLVYALTWYVLAALLAGGVGYAIWVERRPSRKDST
ncbi:MAG: SURF1 family protein [Pseudomonadota bacterium]